MLRTATPGDGTLTLIFADNPLALRSWTVVDAQRRETRVSLFDVQLGGNFDQSLFVFIDPRAFDSGLSNHLTPSRVKYLQCVANPVHIDAMKPLVGISCCTKLFGSFAMPNHAASDTYIRVTDSVVDAVPVLMPANGGACEGGDAAVPAGRHHPDRQPLQRASVAVRRPGARRRHPGKTRRATA